jgi:cholest-4-en-3-one 26-monooxygenase
VEDHNRLDLLDPAFYAGNPGPTYRRLRHESPVYRDLNGIWAVSRHDDVMATERNPDLYSSAQGSRPFVEMTASMINQDDPGHNTQRKLISGRFTPAAIRGHEGTIRHLVGGLIDAIAPKGQAEVVADLAAPLPAMVIARLVGYEPDLWPKVKWWSEATMAAAGYRSDDPGRPSGSEEALADFGAQTLQLYETRRTDPQDDLMSIWAHAKIDGELLPVAEVINEAILLIDGGAETTRSVIGQMVFELARRPELRRLLLERPKLLASTAVDEFIRWSTPILNMRRTVTSDHQLHEEHLRAGDQILLLYGSANRDEGVFERPDELDVTRRHNHHVAFGFGPHFCLGAHLARLELRVVFEELLRRIPDFRICPGSEPGYVPGYFTRTLDEVHIEFAPSQT